MIFFLTWLQFVYEYSRESFLSVFQMAQRARLDKRRCYRCSLHTLVAVLEVERVRVSVHFLVPAAISFLRLWTEGKIVFRRRHWRIGKHCSWQSAGKPENCSHLVIEQETVLLQSRQKRVNTSSYIILFMYLHKYILDYKFNTKITVILNI